MRIVCGAVAACIWLSLAAAAFAADQPTTTVRLGLTKVGAAGPLYVAQDRGYFAAEGLQTTLVFFDNPASIPVGLVSGSIDIGAGPIAAALYTLGGQGAVRIIAGLNRYHHGFHAMAMMASNRAWDGGLKSPAALGGHSLAIPQFGTSPQYSLARLADRYHFDVQSVRVEALQSPGNMVAAVAGNQVDATIIPIIAATPLIESGNGKRFGWLDDEVTLQNGVIEVATQTADQRHDMIERFLAGYRKGARDYHDAFTGPNEEPRLGPQADAVIKIIDKYTGLTNDTALGGSYIDPNGKIDVQDVLRQIAWFKSMKMVKADLDADQILDKRYIVPLNQN